MHSNCTIIIRHHLDCQTKYPGYDVASMKRQSKPTPEVVIVDSIDHKCAKDRNAIFIQPDKNPYYEETNSTIHKTDNADVHTNVDKITVVNNVYYEQ